MSPVSLVVTWSILLAPLLKLGTSTLDVTVPIGCQYALQRLKCLLREPEFITSISQSHHEVDFATSIPPPSANSLVPDPTYNIHPMITRSKEHMYKLKIVYTSSTRHHYTNP